MKAYMSVPGVRSILTDVCGCDAGGAELEAYIITRETEPELPGEAHTLPLNALHFAGPRSGYGAGFALQEALAAFCDD